MRELVIAQQVLVKMLGRETLITRAIQPFDLLLAVTRNPFGRRLAKPAVQQPGLAICLETNTPATERPLGDAKQLSGFDLVEFSQFIAAQNTPELDHSHTLKGFVQRIQALSKEPSITGQIVCYLNRTYRVLPTDELFSLARVLRL